MNQNEWAYANGISAPICERCDGSGRDGFLEATEETDIMSLPTCPDCMGEGSFYDSDINEAMYGL
jgi:DnaJ-class molecular chaperone